jgi:hypothetical protein
MSYQYSNSSDSDDDNQSQYSDDVNEYDDEGHIGYDKYNGKKCEILDNKTWKTCDVKFDHEKNNKDLATLHNKCAIEEKKFTDNSIIRDSLRIQIDQLNRKLSELVNDRTHIKTRENLMIKLEKSRNATRLEIEQASATIISEQKALFDAAFAKAKLRADLINDTNFTFNKQPSDFTSPRIKEIATQMTRLYDKLEDIRHDYEEYEELNNMKYDELIPDIEQQVRPLEEQMTEVQQNVDAAQKLIAFITKFISQKERIYEYYQYMTYFKIDPSNDNDNAGADEFENIIITCNKHRQNWLLREMPFKTHNYISLKIKTGYIHAVKFYNHRNCYDCYGYSVKENKCHCGHTKNLKLAVNHDFSDPRVFSITSTIPSGVLI